MTRVVGAATMLTLATVGLRTTDAHAAIESHAAPCTGQPESSGVAPCHSAVKPSWVDVAFDATAEWFVSDAEPMELSIDISL